MRTDARLLRTVVVLGLLPLTAGGCKWLDDQMAALTPNRSMRNSVSYDPYERPHLPDSNAVAFASGNYPSARDVVNLGEPEGLEADVPRLTLADTNPPGSERVNALMNPVPADAVSLARGEILFNRNCAVCHSTNGVGLEAPIADKMPIVGLYDLATGAAVDFSDGYIYGMLSVGRGVMPPYGDRITYFDRWNVVNWVRQLQAAAGPAAPGGGD